MGPGYRSVKIYPRPRRAGGWAAGRHQKQSGPITAKACNQTCPPGFRLPGALDTTVGVCATELAIPTGRNTSISWGWAKGAAAPAQQTLQRTPLTLFLVMWCVCVCVCVFFSLFVILVKNSAVPLPSCEWVGASPGPSSYPALGHRTKKVPILDLVEGPWVVAPMGLELLLPRTDRADRVACAVL